MRRTPGRVNFGPGRAGRVPHLRAAPPQRRILDATIAGADLDGDPWVGQQIVGPVGILRPARVGDEDEDPFAVPQVCRRVRVRAAGPSARCAQKDERSALEQPAHPAFISAAHR